MHYELNSESMERYIEFVAKTFVAFVASEHASISEGMLMITMHTHLYHSAHFFGSYFVKKVLASSWKIFCRSEKSNLFELRVSEYRKFWVRGDPANFMFIMDANFYYERIVHLVNITLKWFVCYHLERRSTCYFWGNDGSGRMRLDFVKKCFQVAGFLIKCLAFSEWKVSTPSTNVLVDYLNGETNLKVKTDGAIHVFENCARRSHSTSGSMMWRNGRITYSARPIHISQRRFWVILKSSARKNTNVIRQNEFLIQSLGKSMDACCTRNRMSANLV